jgi:hypothetical protein
VIIKSSFIDYYDYCSRFYGDDSHVYLRDYQTKSGCGYLHPGGHDINVSMPLGCLPHFARWYWVEVAGREYNNFRIVVVCGKCYIKFIRHKKNNSYPYADYKCVEAVYNPQKHQKIRESLLAKEGFDIESIHGRGFPSLLDIAKKAKAPIFMIESITYIEGANKVQVCVDCKCPNLKRLGFSSMISAMDMFKDLSSYLYKMQPSGDIIVGDIPNDCKIAEHGFDKYSFRKAPTKKKRLVKCY